MDSYRFSLALFFLLHTRAHVGTRKTCSAYVHQERWTSEKQQSGATQQKALGTLVRLTPHFRYKGIYGSVPFHCSDIDNNQIDYTGPVQKLGAGAHGVTVVVHRGSESGQKVVAKLFKGKKEKENLSHECSILRSLKSAGVPNTVECEASCENNNYPMIIVTPFKEQVKAFRDAIEEDYFASAQAARQALKATLVTGMAMLEAGFANIDQGYNILYGKDGCVTFIDMGIAENLREIEAHSRLYSVEAFLEALFEKVPTSWFQDGRLMELMREVQIPEAPNFFGPPVNLSTRLWSMVSASANASVHLPTVVEQSWHKVKARKMRAKWRENSRKPLRWEGMTVISDYF